MPRYPLCFAHSCPHSPTTPFSCTRTVTLTPLCRHCCLHALCTLYTPSAACRLTGLTKRWLRLTRHIQSRWPVLPSQPLHSVGQNSPILLGIACAPASAQTASAQTMPSSIGSMRFFPSFLFLFADTCNICTHFEHRQLAPKCLRLC